MRTLPLCSLLALCVGSAGCGTRSQDASRFHGAVTLDDGRTGLVSYQRARSAPVETNGGLLAFGGSVWGNVRDRKVVATVDLESGAVDVLLRDERPRPSTGGDYRIAGVAGRRALLHRTAWRDPRTGGREVPATWLLLDLDTRATAEVDVHAELEALGRSTEAAGQLVHRTGVLSGVCSRAADDPPEWDSALYLRAPDGRYRFRGNERTTRVGRDVMLTYDAVRRASFEVDPVRGEARRLTPAEASARDRALVEAERARRRAAPGLFVGGSGARILSSNGAPPPLRDLREFEIDVDRLR